jgi:hypothetical protein
MRRFLPEDKSFVIIETLEGDSSATHVGRCMFAVGRQCLRLVAGERFFQDCGAKHRNDLFWQHFSFLLPDW